FFYRSAAPRVLHSFPTRRSSDLRAEQAAPLCRWPARTPPHDGRGAARRADNVVLVRRSWLRSGARPADRKALSALQGLVTRRAVASVAATSQVRRDHFLKVDALPGRLCTQAGVEAGVEGEFILAA